jgi:hypothetical protein
MGVFVFIGIPQIQTLPGDREYPTWLGGNRGATLAHYFEN